VRKNGPFIGVVTSLVLLIAVAVWQFSILTSDVRIGGPYAGKLAERSLDDSKVRPAIAVSPR